MRLSMRLGTAVLIRVIMSVVKVAVVLHSGPNLTKKAWRFNSLDIQSYTLKSTEAELLQLFPVVKEKGLGLELSYQDDMIATIKIEGDLDLHTALQSFSEEWMNKAKLENLTLHATDIIKPLVVGPLRKRKADRICRKSKKPKLVSNCVCSGYEDIFLDTITSLYVGSNR